jgi:hypothetical protein
MKYELGFYIREDGVLHNHSRENLKSDINSPSKREEVGIFLVYRLYHLLLYPVLAQKLNV